MGLSIVSRILKHSDSPIRIAITDGEKVGYRSILSTKTRIGHELYLFKDNPRLMAKCILT